MVKHYHHTFNKEDQDFCSVGIQNSSGLFQLTLFRITLSMADLSSQIILKVIFENSRCF